MAKKVECTVIPYYYIRLEFGGKKKKHDGLSKSQRNRLKEKVDKD